MTPLNAIIAQNVKGEMCDFREYPFDAFSATTQHMEKIDRHWIKKRLQDMPRGTQSRLAERMGVAPNVMSKVMNGTRELQQDEIPKVLAFFNAKIVEDQVSSDDLQFLLQGAAQLNRDGLRLLRKQLDEMLRTPSLAARNESDSRDS